MGPPAPLRGGLRTASPQHREGRAYVTGITDSARFPVTPGAVQTENPLASVLKGDAFVARLNPAGTQLAHSALLGGGGGGDSGNAIAVDGSGQARVTGLTYSSTLNEPFPVAKAALGPAGGI